MRFRLFLQVDFLAYASEIFHFLNYLGANDTSFHFFKGFC